MKAFEFKRLIAVALVACLPIACGTSSPTGPVIDALDTDSTVSALRAGPGLPLMATPEPKPMPEINTPTDAPTDVVVVPVPDPTRRPRPTPSIDPGPQPDADAGAIPTPHAPPLPAPDAPPVLLPPSPQEPGPDRAGQCFAAQAEIMILGGSPQPTFANSVRLEMVMLGSDGKQITDRSCRGLAWSFVEGRFAAGATITVSDDARFATVTGTPGPYQIRAITSNGLMATVGITLQ